MWVLIFFTLFGLLGHIESAITRTYYIATVEVDWDYAPSNMDRATGQMFDQDPMMMNEMMSHSTHGFETYTKRNNKFLGKVYKKAIYKQYTSSSFRRAVNHGTRTEHLGLLGPTIYAEVGDTIEVVFKNTASFNFSIHAHGVFYQKASEGTLTQMSEMGMKKGVVAPGEIYTYIWQVPERAGPAENDPSSIAWLYHSHVDETADVNAGLVGMIVITRPGMLTMTSDGVFIPRDVQREFFLLFNIFDENASHYLMQNVMTYAGKPERVTQDVMSREDWMESNRMFSINGYIYNNLQGLQMSMSETVRWYVFGLGNQLDIHTAHWHGNTIVDHGFREDTVAIFPATSRVVTMIPDNAGEWLLHCHVDHHIHAGMSVFYIVDGPMM